jgi:4-hydroxybenzoate polyprenyltransferase
MAKQRPVTDSPAWAGIRLIRPWNVLMIVVAMGLITESLLLPAFGGELPPHQQAIFALGTLAMAALAAGANVINDYFDVAEDRVNRPDRTFVGRGITRRQTLALNYTLTGIAVLSSFGIAAAAKCIVPAFWIVILGVLLWGYSPWFKRRFLRGNLIIALSVGQLPLWCLALLESRSFDRWLELFKSTEGNILLGYVVLSGYITLLREITKDWQDAEGDALAGYDTLPVRWGPKRTKSLLHRMHFVGWGMIGVTWWASITLVHRPLAPLFFALPFLAVHIQLARNQVASVSAWQKLTLAGGLLYLAGFIV